MFRTCLFCCWPTICYHIISPFYIATPFSYHITTTLGEMCILCFFLSALSLEDFVFKAYNLLMLSWLPTVTHTMNQAYCLEHFKSCLSKASVGVLTGTTSPNLVCWILRDYNGLLHHLYTVEQYRRRGLASAVVRMMCKRIQDQGDVPFCYVYNDNHTSTTLFHSLGFTESQEQFFH